MMSGCVALKAVVDRTQLELERVVTEEYPVGLEVTFVTRAGRGVGFVTGHKGEVLLIGGHRRHWSKVEVVVRLPGRGAARVGQAELEEAHMKRA